MNRKRIILRFLCAALLLSGLGLLLYPSVNAWLEKRKIGQHVEAFRNTVTALQQSGGKAVSATATMEESAPPYAELLEAMEAYNESIFADKQAGFCDPWSYQAPVFDLAEYGIEDGIVGILSIPKMDLELPIYLGATAEHLASGAAQLSQTSIPWCIQPEYGSGSCPVGADQHPGGRKEHKHGYRGSSGMEWRGLLSVHYRAGAGRPHHDNQPMGNPDLYRLGDQGHRAKRD